MAYDAMEFIEHFGGVCSKDRAIVSGEYRH